MYKGLKDLIWPIGIINYSYSYNAVNELVFAKPKEAVLVY